MNPTSCVMATITPPIIDALIGPASSRALKELLWLRNSSADAEALRKNLPLPERKLFDAVEDS